MTAPTPGRAEFPADDHCIVHLAADAKPDLFSRVQFTAFWPTDQEWVPGGVRAQVWRADVDEWVARQETSGWKVTVVRVGGGS